MIFIMIIYFNFCGIVWDVFDFYWLVFGGMVIVVIYG